MMFFVMGKRVCKNCITFYRSGEAVTIFYKIEKKIIHFSTESTVWILDVYFLYTIVYKSLIFFIL